MIENKNEKQNPSFITIMKIYLKSNKKRIKFSLIFIFLLFIFTSTLLLTWISYQNVSFQKHSTEIDWFNDQNLSSFTKYNKVISNNISANYLDSALSDIQELYEKEIPGVISKISGTVEIVFKGPDPIYGDLTDYTIKTFDQETINIINSDIIEGNLPQNSSELLLLYSEGPYQDYFEISDILQLKPNLPDINLNNYSISGIVHNLKETLKLYDYSSDLVFGFPRNERYDYYTYSQSIQTFITTPDYLFGLLNNFTLFSGTTVIAFDITFNETAINYSIVEKYKAILSQWMDGIELPFDSQVLIKIGADLLDVFDEFQQEWRIETIKMGITGILVSFLLILVIFETMNYNKKELQHTFRLMKIQGLDNKKIRKVVLIESVFIASASLLFGLIFSTVISYVLISILNWKISFGFFMSNLVNPLFTVIVFGLFVLILLISFCLKMSYSNNSRVDISELLEEKDRRGIRKFLTSFELIFFTIGGVALSVSIPGIIVLVRESSVYQPLDSNLFNLLLLVLLLLGSFFILISIISLFAKFIAFSWSIIGKYFWTKNKGIANLSLKNISQSYLTYQRSIMVVLFVGFSLLPGFVIYPSINNHIETNSLLAGGYSDLIIYSWNGDEVLSEKISNLTGINLTTVTTQMKFRSIGLENIRSEVDILSINATEFVKVVSSNEIEILNHDCSNIELLKSDMTCFINSQFANEYGYSRTNKIKIENFWDSINNYQLSPIANFIHFPLIPNYIQYQGERLFDRTLHIQLVLDARTYEQIIADAFSVEILSTEQQFLIKLNDGVNITDIQSQIYNEFGINAKSIDEIRKSSLNNLADFNVILVIISSIFSILILFFNGFVVGQDIYQQRLRNIEADYRLGATKKQILFEYSLEITLIVFLPMIFAILLGVITSQYYHIFLNIEINYLNFKSWIPWWVVILIFILSFTSIFLGWYSNIYYNIRDYKPTKQE